MSTCRDCTKPLSAEKTIGGDRLYLYIQPGGCVELTTQSDIEGDDYGLDHHFCDWPGVVAFVAEEVERRKCCIYDTDINPDYNNGS